MSTATALGVSGDIAPHVGYASSHSSESGLKGRPGSPDSPLLWAGVPIACSHLESISAVTALVYPSIYLSYSAANPSRRSLMLCSCRPLADL